MPQWERRLTRVSHPARRLEHELRYRLVAPLVARAELWVDLGCGTGIGAATALAGALPPGVLLVDVDEDALAEARNELPGADALAADLASVEGTGVVREAIGEASAVVTCFGTLAHLSDFTACVELLAGLAERCAVVLSVPNDAVWAIENPFHPTMWGEGAFDELRRVVPAEHVILEQVPIAASAIVGPGATHAPLASAHVANERVASDFLLAFGPGTDALAPVAGARAVDAAGARQFERQRDSELALLAARVAELEAR
jgi:SAM-dependent methyltransferase